MTVKDFFGKLLSKYLWGNILAMVLVVVALLFGLSYALDRYTLHGESVEVPDFGRMPFGSAFDLAERRGLRMVVEDSGYNKKLAPDCVLAQNPEGGSRVKSGRTVYVIVNSTSSPMVAIPDLVDNSSVRAAEARLKAMGFKLKEPQMISGEKDWVYGILHDGKALEAGDKVPVEAVLVLQVGDGTYDGEDIFVDYTTSEDVPEGEADEFEVVTGPPM